jgi:hypothetical protein
MKIELFCCRDKWPEQLSRLRTQTHPEKPSVFWLDQSAAIGERDVRR